MYMKVKDRIKMFLSWFRFLRRYRQRHMLRRVGAVTLYYFHKDRKLRRKIKDTPLEYALIKILQHENK